TAADEPPTDDATADEVSPASEAVEAAREVLRSAHLGELASRTRVGLQHGRPLQRPSADIAEIVRRLPRSEAEIERLRTPARLARIPHISQRERADLRQAWRRHGTLFEEWQTMLLEHSAALEEARTEIVELRRSWAALRDASLAAGRPDGRHERIMTSLEEVRSAAIDLDAQRELVLGLQDRVSELSLAVEDVTEQLRAASAAYRERLFVRDRPALWVGLGDEEAEASLAAQARESWSERGEAAAEMLSAQVPALMRQFFVFALLAGLMLVLAQRSRAWPQGDETLAIARAVTRRPFATALLVTLLSMPLAIRHPPIVLYDVVFLLSLVPLVRVLGPVAPPHVRPVIYVLAAFLFIDRIETMAPDGSGLRRLLLLLESGGAVAALAYWAYFRARAVDPLTSMLRGAATACGALLAAAFVANAIGYVFLATMLMRGTAFSVYSGLAIVATVLIAQSMLDLAIRSDVGRRLHTVRDHGVLIHRRALRWLTIGGGLVWAGATLAGYGLLTPLSKWTEETLEHRWHVGTLEISIGAIGLGVLIIVLTVALTRLVRFVLEIDVLPRMRLEPGVDGAISGMTRYAIFAIGLLLALASMGIDASQLALIAGALGVGIGFGLQGIVANFIAGLVLMLERPVRLGDFIEVGPLVGRVDRIGLRSSTVRAFDGAEVIVPNESLISREVVNWTLSDRQRRVEVKVGVAYGTDPQRVISVIRAVADTHVTAVGGTEPNALFVGFGDSSLDFVLQFWTADFADAIRLRSEIGLRVHDALAEAGIEIPFPQRDIHVKSLPEQLTTPVAPLSAPAKEG
ncbi:MAG: mechanosensitive ion channel, partial [Myxococcota bacterium]|nr:mechanosensitive ion channel [Myxococcota bacterium]